MVNSSLLPDVTAAEDSALSGTGGTGSLTKLLANTAILTGTNTYSGTTTIRA